MRGTPSTLERLAVVIGTIAIAAFLLLLINDAIYDYRNILFRSGDITTYLMIAVFMFLLGMLIKKLLVWNVRAEFRRRR